MATEYESVDCPLCSVDCPLCGETIQLVSSDTLSLALWQHFNWLHFDVMDFYKSIQQMEA